jgi:hypothetical protein
MGDAPPVTVPTSAPEPFDSFDEPFGDFPSALDDAGRLLGVERDAGRAVKAAPSAFEETSRAEYAAPSAAAVAAAAAAQRAMADARDALADGFEREHRSRAYSSLGVQIGTIGPSRSVALATASIAMDAKTERRAEQLERYGRGTRVRPSTAGTSRRLRSARGVPKSVYAQDVEAQASRRAEREAREAKARAPFITARFDTKLPAPVDALILGDKSARARARRAAAAAAAAARAEPRSRPCSAEPQRRMRAAPSSFGGFPPATGRVWRVNANVAHDVMDPISVSFNDAKRARAVAESRAREALVKRDAGRARTVRIDRSKYPSFKTWLEAQAKHDAAMRAAVPGFAVKPETTNRETDRVAANPEGKETEEAFTEAAIEAAAAEAAAKAKAKAAAEAALAVASDGVAGNHPEDLAEGVARFGAAPASSVDAAPREDEASSPRELARAETPTRKDCPETFIVGQNPRGSPRALFASDPFGEGSVGIRSNPSGGKDISIPIDRAVSNEEQLAAHFAKMTPDERLAARARFSKGWSGDFTPVFRAADSKASEPEPGAKPSPAPIWSEKPVASSRRAAGKALEPEHEGLEPEHEGLEPEPDRLSVRFIGANAAELEFRALHPDSDASPPGRQENALEDSRKPRYVSPEAIAAAEAARRASEGLDPSDPDVVERAKERLASMGVHFFGKRAGEFAFKAVFPDHEVPGSIPRGEKNTRDAAASAAKRAELLGEDPCVPLAHLAGASGLAAEIIGSAARESPRRPPSRREDDLDEAEIEKTAARGGDAEAEASMRVLPSTPERGSNFSNAARVDPGDGFDRPERSEASPETSPEASSFSAASPEETRSLAEAVVPGAGSSVAPTTAAVDGDDAGSLAGSVRGPESLSNDFEPSVETGTASAVFDLGSGASVPTALVAPLADEVVRDASMAGGEDFAQDLWERSEAFAGDGT